MNFSVGDNVSIVEEVNGAYSVSMSYITKIKDNCIVLSYGSSFSQKDIDGKQMWCNIVPWLKEYAFESSKDAHSFIMNRIEGCIV